MASPGTTRLRRRRGRPLIAALVVAAVVAWALPVSAADAGGTDASDARASLSQSLEAPASPTIGDPLELHLRVEHPPETTASVDPQLERSRWELTGERSSTTSDESGATTRLTLTFQIYRPGETTLAPLEVAVSGSDEDGGQLLRTDPVTVTVASVLGDDAEANFQGPRPPRSVWRRDMTLVWAGGGVLAVLVGGLAFLFLRREEDEEERGLQPERPPEEVALEKLASLGESDLLEHGNFMVFYVRMSEALRRYLGRRFGFPGTELTTHEIVEKLRTTSWNGEAELDDIATWLRKTDLVKFSGRIPSTDEAQGALERAVWLVGETHTRPASDPTDVDDADDREADGGAADGGEADDARSSSEVEGETTDESPPADEDPDAPYRPADGAESTPDEEQ